MPYLLVHHKVADFAKWKRVFDSHAAAQQQAGLRVMHVLRNVEDPNDVVMLFAVEDVERAKSFVYSPQVPGAKEESGVLDVPNIYFLR